MKIVEQRETKMRIPRIVRAVTDAPYVTCMYDIIFAQGYIFVFFIFQNKELLTVN
jgi:hypothetical protein